MFCVHMLVVLGRHLGAECSVYTCWLSWVDIQGQSYWLTFLFDFLSKILLLKITDLLSPIYRKWDPNFSTFLLMILALILFLNLPWIKSIQRSFTHLKTI